MTSRLNRIRNSLGIAALAVTVACGGGGGNSPTTPPMPTPTSVELRFQDYVPSGRKADLIRVSVTAPNGQVKPTDAANTVVFDYDNSGSAAGQYCIGPGGSHIKSPTGNNECISVNAGGSYVIKLIENAPDVLSFWSNGDAGRYDPTPKRGLANTTFSAGQVNTINNGFATAAACTHSGTSSADRGAVPGNNVPPAGYNFVIIEGGAFFNGTVMHLPFDVTAVSAAGEGERVAGVYGDYGGFEQGRNLCAYPVAYGTEAVTNGAPRR